MQRVVTYVLSNEEQEDVDAAIEAQRIISDAREKRNAAVVKLHRQGLSMRVIEDLTGVGYTTVHRAVKQVNNA